MIENFAIILSLIFPFLLNGEILAPVVDSQGQTAIVAYFEDDPNQPGDPESVTTTAENSPIEVMSDGNLYFLKIDLQDSRVRVRVGLANNDSGGYESLASMKNRYAGQSLSEWAIINGDYFGSGCPSNINCAQGLTYIDGNKIDNWSAYGTTWPVRGNIGFDSSRSVQIAIGDAQSKRNMTIAGGPWIVKDGGSPTCQGDYINGTTYFSTGEQFTGDQRWYCTTTSAVTMAGYSSDRRYLFIGVSSGGWTVIQVAQWLKDRGAFDVLKLDGGGSSGIYYNDSLMKGSGSRAIANHLAIVVDNAPPQPPPSSWKADYYDNQDRWWDNNNSGSYKCSETINGPGLDKNYGPGAPCGGMDGDTWIGDYSATINFPTGNYVFGVEHDDGLKLWINGQNIADRGGSGTSWVCPARSLSGNSNLRVMLREDGGDARVKLSWTTDTSVCNDPPSIPSLLSPHDNSIITNDIAPGLCWQNNGDPNGDSVEFFAEVYNSSINLSSGWISDTCWQPTLMNDPYGIYQWHVKSRDNRNAESDWSTTWHFSLQNPIQVIDSLTISPQDPLVGESVTAHFRIKNISAQSITITRILAGARGPNCTEWTCNPMADWPVVEAITIQPGQEYSYSKQRVFTEKGSNYFAQISYSNSSDQWFVLGSKITFSVGAGIEISQPLYLSPVEPIANLPVSATFVIRNNGIRSITLQKLSVEGRGPNCTDLTCQNWAGFEVASNITLPPGEEYFYSKTSSFQSAGSGYFDQPMFADQNDWWYIVPGGSRLNFSVDRGLELIEELSLNQTTPLTGEDIVGRFKLRNMGSHTIHVDRIGVGSQGPNCASFSCQRVVDFPWKENVTFLPGQEYAFEEHRVFTEVGNGYIAQIMYSVGRDYWKLMGNQKAFSVASGLLVTTPISLNPSDPVVNQPITATYTLKNIGSRAIFIRAINADGRGPNCTDLTCQNWAGFMAKENLSLGPGQEIQYSATRSFDQAGSGYFVEPLFMDANGWWLMLPGAQQRTYSVDRGLEVVSPLTLTPSTPLAGESVTAEFKLKNMGNHVLHYERIGVGAHGPNCQDWSCNSPVDYPWHENVTIQPGQEIIYSQMRTFIEPGSDYFAQITLFGGEDFWWQLGDIKRFLVSPGIEISTPISLTPQDPSVFEPVVASYTIQNKGSRAITIRRLGVVARGPNCVDWTCERNVDFQPVENITLLPGQDYTYLGQRSFAIPGQGYFVEPAFEDLNGWWFPICLACAQKRNFTVNPFPFSVYLPLLQCNTR